MRMIDLSCFEFRDVVRPGDTVLWGQVCAEPTTLTEELLRQRHTVGNFTIVMGFRTASIVKPEHADVIQMRALNAGGANRLLAKAKVLDILPIHVSHVEAAISRGDIACDVVMVQVSPPDENGRYSLGLVSDYIKTAIDRARVVIAEINDQVPWTMCDTPLTADDIDFAVQVSKEPPQVPGAVPGAIDELIANWAIPFIPEKATLQLGVGATPEALVAKLHSHRGLGVHSGLLTDSLVDLVECGAVTNEHKPIDRGVSVSGALMGTNKLYRFCDRNPAIRMAPLSYTHNPVVLAQLPDFISINSALEVDLTGQVNAEALGNTVIGGVGGQVDFIRAAAGSPGGRSMIVLPSRTQNGSVSRIKFRLTGPVTTARSDVDLVISEHGVAELRGRSVRQRIEAMLLIADPEFHEELAQEAHALLKTC